MKHKQRIIAIILSLLMIFCAVPAYAAEDKDTLDKAKFQGAVPNDKAEEIHFCKKTDMPAEATKDKGDISVAGAGGKIHVYADNTEKKYWVVHEADGKIFFPEDSGKLFYDCTKLTTVTFDQIDTGKVTSMYAMFLKCRILTSLDLTSFNTEKVTDMGLMFCGCSALTSLDLTSFNTEKVTDMFSMFNGCSALTTITASGQFTTANVGGSDRMFLDCTSLVGGQGTTYKDENPKDKTYARIDGGIPNPGYFRDKAVTYTISFDKNGGGGNMPDVTVNDGDNYTLPSCGFTPPAGQVFDQWEADGTKYNPGDIINNIIADLSVKAIWKAKPATPYIPSTTIPSTEEDQTPEEWITLETVVNGKTYTARSTKNAFNGAVKLDIAIGEQGKTHFNFLDKEGNKVQTKGAVKLTMPLPEGLTPPYRVKVEGTYTTFAEEQGQISFVIRPTGDVEKIHLTGIAEGETVNVEGTPYALNGAKEIKVERKGNGKLSIRLIDQNGKPVRSKGYLFIQIPVPKNTKAPYRVKVDGVRTTFEETGHGTVVFASIL